MVSLRGEFVASTYLLDTLEVILHALNGNILASLYTLGLEHFRKSALTLLANQPVLLHFIYLDSNAQVLAKRKFIDQVFAI